MAEFNEDEIGFEDMDEIFNSATEYIRQIGGRLESDQLLYFYARFKQAKEGKCNVPKPSFFDFQGKAKWDAWNNLGNMEKSQAKIEYISLLTNMDQEWKNKLGTTGPGGGDSDPSTNQSTALGVSVSVMANPDTELSADQKTIFDWCKEGDLNKVRDLLTAGSVNVDGVDEEGLSLLHWASDRGHCSMVELLLGLGANINIQDEDRQTALHYAVSCDHEDVTEMLVAKGIDQSLKDLEGHMAVDVASDDMKLLLRRLGT